MTILVLVSLGAMLAAMRRLGKYSDAKEQWHQAVHRGELRTGVRRFWAGAPDRTAKIKASAERRHATSAMINAFLVLTASTPARSICH